MKPAPKVSIVTALYNQLDLTRAYLSSLYQTAEGLDYELILIDNASTDGTREFLESECREHTLILNKQNLGFAPANNQGAKLAKGEVLALINNDVVLMDGWAEPMLDLFEGQSSLGMVGNVQIHKGTGLVDHAGMVFNREGTGMHYGKGYPRKWISHLKAFPAVTAACCMVRRELFLEHGGFDESYVNGFEDLDLCMRLGAAGYKHIVAGESAVWHHVSASEGRHVAEDENRKLFLSRWAETSVPLGQKQWPQNYLLQHWRKPWRLNGRKALDAISGILRSL